MLKEEVCVDNQVQLGILEDVWFLLPAASKVSISYRMKENTDLL